MNRGTNAWQAATAKQNQTLQQLGRTARFAAGGVGLLGGIAIVKSIGVAADFEQQISRLGAVSSASAKQMETLKRQALAAGAATKFSALDAAQAQTELAKGGLSVQQIMGGGLRAALGLAAAGELELADAATYTVNAIKLFGLEGRQAAGVADAFATAANKTTADVGDFGIALRQGGSAAKAAGLSFHETIAALEALAEGGIKGSDAGTSLKTSLAQMAKPTAKAAKLAEELGINFFDAEGNMKPLVEISGMLQDKLGGLTREQRLQAITTLVGTDGMRTLLSLYEAGPAKIARFEAGLRKQGTAADVAAKKQDNFRGKLENFQGSIETLQISVGSQLLPTFTRTAERLTVWANNVARISNRKDLDVGQKIRLSLKALDREFGPDLKRLDIPGKLAAAISFAVPKMAEAAARAAPKAVAAFFNAWRESNIWGKLVIGGFLLSKFGGFAAFRALGAKGGASFAQGFASTAGVGAAGAAAGGAGAGAGAAAAGALGGAALGKRGRIATAPGFRSGAPVSQIGPRGLAGVPANLKASAARIAPQVRSIGKGVLGVALVAGIADAVTSEGTFNDRLRNAISTMTLGIVPGADLEGRLQKKIKTALQGAMDPAKIGTLRGPAVTDAFFEGLEQDLPEKQKKILRTFTDLRKRAVELFGKGAKVKLDVVSDPQAALRSFDKLEVGMNRLKNRLAGDARGIVNVTRQNLKQLPQIMDVQSKAGQVAVTRNMKLTARAIVDAVDRGSSNARQGMRAIRQAFVVNSQASKQTTQKNFGLALSAIRNTMGSGKKASREGLAEIRKLFLSYLGQFGIKGREAEIYLDVKPGKGKPLNYQKGGLVQFGQRGGAGPDNIPVRFGGQDIRVGSGEVGAVFNRHQLPVLNARLADMGGLPGLFRRYDRNHSQGGVVSGVKQFAAGGIVALGRKLQREGYMVGEHPAFGGVDPVHVPNSYHYRGMALDVNADNFPGGEMAALDKLYARLKRLPGVVELLWRVANHFDHLHVAMAGTGDLSGLGGLAAKVKKIGRMEAGGPDSALKAGIQTGLDRVRATANDKLAAAAASMGVEGAEPGVVGTGPKSGAASRAQMVKWARSALEQTAIFPANDENVEKILTLAMKESSWITDSINLWDSNAAAGNPSGGLMHITIDKVGGSKKRLFDPVDNIATSIRYQKSRYGRLVTFSPYAKGGLVGMVGDSLGVGTAGPLKGRLHGKLRSDTKESRRSGTGLEILKRKFLGKDFDKYVFDLGTNDSSAGELAGSVRGADKATGRKPLVVPTVNGPEASAKNRRLRAMAGGDISLVEWAKRSSGLVGDDGVHATGAGYSKRAAMISGVLAQVRAPKDKDAPGRLPKLKGSLIRKSRQTAAQLAKTKDKARRAKILKRFAKVLRSKKYGLPARLLNEIDYLGAAHTRFFDLTDTAQLLNVDVENEDGTTTTTLGSVAGDNVAGWLTKDLSAMFSMRNKLIKAKGIVEKNKVKTDAAFRFVSERIKGLSKPGRTPSGWDGINPATGDVEKWNKQEQPKRVKRMREWRSKRGSLPGTRDFDRRGRVSEVPKAKVSAFKTVRNKLRGQRADLADSLSAEGENSIPARLGELQGQGPPQILRSPWPIGTIFGGDILQAQLDIRDLFTVPPKVTDDTTGTDAGDDTRVPLLEQLLRESNLRLSVQERQFDVLRNFPPFGGVFHSGGVVPGPPGAERMVLAQAGERIIANDGGGGSSVPMLNLIFEGKARAFEDLIDARVEHVTRRQARSGGRVLPGRSGGT